MSRLSIRLLESPQSEFESRLIKVDTVDTLFHEKAVFVHKGGNMNKEQELDVIKSGGIHYKKADIHEVSVNIIDTTAILLNRITLLAVVGRFPDQCGLPP